MYNWIPKKQHKSNRPASHLLEMQAWREHLEEAPPVATVQLF